MRRIEGREQEDKDKDQANQEADPLRVERCYQKPRHLPRRRFVHCSISGAFQQGVKLETFCVKLGAFHIEKITGIFNYYFCKSWNLL